MDVSLQVRSGCEVGNQVGAVDFGRLDFGQHGPTWAEFLTADGRSTAAGGQVRVVCSPNIDGFLVSVDGGRNGTQATRYVVKRDGAGHVVARVPYNVYRDPARSVPYVPLIPQSFRVDDDHTAVALPLFGVVQGQAQALPAGIYQDLLGITLDW
ncbi:spore coat U domain-containing protein [Burkholderia anthina]|uniref:Csu type fimbrial protein n=1 Tax=Burkholderia anthina TaxID=179879 RepID=UPI001CF5B689|nr:spore coat U domain-containing protein [Burkholderia anthina]MCA8089365.1 spore coat U domain-containing protein [Burkholderia anthina]